MQPIRILMINSKMQCAGIENWIMNFYRNIDRSRFQFDFLVHWQERQYFDDEIERLGGRIYRLSVREDYRVDRYYRELCRFFREHDEYKIVHGHMESFGVFYFHAAKKAGVPVRIAHAHVVGVESGLKNCAKNLMNKGFARDANAFFSCSEAATRYLFGNQRTVHYIKNAVEVEKFAYDLGVRMRVRRELGLDGCHVIGHAGRFDIVKNQLFLIRAFADVCKRRDDARLMLVGDGNLRADAEREAARLGILNRVLFMGLRNDLPDLYQAMDVFALPSIHEAMPLVAVEAQTAGLPCIASDGVSAEAKVLPNSQMLPLDPRLWVDRLSANGENIDRAAATGIMRDNGYDLNRESKVLSNLYMKLLEEHI